jgi:hypothetical protein
MLFVFTIEPDRIVGIEALCSKCKRNNKEKDVLAHSEGLLEIETIKIIIN